MVGLLSECWGQMPIHYLRLWYLGYAGQAVPVSLWDTGDLGFVTVSVAAFVTAITQQEQVLIILIPAHLTVLQNKRAIIILINEVGNIRIVFFFFYLLLTTLMMDLSQAMDFCSCWMHMDNWAALRTPLRAFLHTFMPGATSSSPLGEDNMEGWEGDEKKEKTHTYVHIGVKSHKHKVEPGYI